MAKDATPSQDARGDEGGDRPEGEEPVGQGVQEGARAGGDRYREVLMQRIREDRYPSHHLMDRVEACLRTPDQTDAYVNLLVDKMHETHYPSNGIMDRLQRYTCGAEPE